MYESEINRKAEPTSTLPDRVVEFFQQCTPLLEMRTTLPWSEHCTECVWPSCYTSCDLYEARSDGKCRRFVDGMVRVDLPQSPNGYVIKIKFKQWGKLWAVGNLHLITGKEAHKAEAKDQWIGTALQRIALPSSAKAFLSTRRYNQKKRQALRQKPIDTTPTAFLLECHNPQSHSIDVSLTIRSSNPTSKIPYQELLTAKPGPNRFRIPYNRISSAVNLREPFHIELIPNDVSDGTTLYFGVLDFVLEKSELTNGADDTAAKRNQEIQSPKIKCVVWDLDNTVWSGILAEDGPGKLALKEGIRDIIHELDRRGILQSVASKNNHEEAFEVLKAMNLHEYLLFPQINWNPKSQGIARIAKLLNIGLDTFLFIDDSTFEREEVKTSHPMVRVLDALEYRTLTNMPELTVPITEESANRRKMYVMEGERTAAAEIFGDDYFAFLRNCQLTMTLSPMDEGNLERVHELTQRTNQMNFSGNRYDRDKLTEILHDPSLDTYVIRCKDKFGSYGVVGFAIVDKREPRLTDLMFSCRIQSKRVEHAFLWHVIEKYAHEEGRDFHANYRKTKRNAPSGQVFADIGFEEGAIIDGVSRLVFSGQSAPSPDKIIQIIESSRD